MRIFRISLITAALGFFFLFVSYVSGSQLKESKAYSFPESLGRHYAGVSNLIVNGEIEGGDQVVVKKSIPGDSAAPTELIEIETTAVDVEIIPSEGDDITLTLKSNFVDPSQPMLLDSSRRGVLRVLTQERSRRLFSQKAWMMFHFDNDSKPLKNNQLIVSVPKSAGQLKIKTISGDAQNATVLTSLTFESESGDFRTDTEANPLARIQTLSVNTVSGDLVGPGRFDSVKFKSVSGDLDLKNLDRVLALEANTVSGSVDLTTQESPNAEIIFTTVTGKAKVTSADLNRSKTEETSDGKTIHTVVGTGLTKMRIQTVSGNLSLK